MAGAASVARDNSLLSRLDVGLYRVERVLALVCGLFVFGLMVLAVVSVGGREALERPLPGYVDWIELAMPFIAILAISFVQRDGAHIRMDMLIGALRGRLLWAVELFTTALVLVLVLALIWGSWAHFQRSFDFAAPLWSRDSTIDIGLPVWPSKLIVPVALSVLAARLGLQIWGYLRALGSGEATPVAVPVPRDVAAQAAEEAGQLAGHDD